MKVLILILLFPLSFLCQDGVIKGKVEAQKSKKTILGASIHLIGTSKGTASDINGNYELKDLLPGTYKMRCSFIGAKNQDTTVFVQQNDTLTVDFSLTAAVKDSIKITIQKHE